MEVHDVVQEAVIKTIPKKKKGKKAKRSSEEALQIAEKRREAKVKGEKERYTHLSAESKIRDTKQTYHAKVGTIKDRNHMDLTEAEDIKKRWQEYTEKLYRKDLHDPDNHDGVITDLEPDILECEVKWALGSITTNKASEGDGIPIELFEILKDDAVKVLHSICQQIWETAVATGLENFSVLSNPKEKQY